MIDSIEIIQSQAPMSRNEYVALYGRPLWELECEQIDAECNAIEAELDEACERARAFLKENKAASEPAPNGPSELVLKVLGADRCLEKSELLEETGLGREDLYFALGNLITNQIVQTNPAGWYWRGA